DGDRRRRNVRWHVLVGPHQRHRHGGSVHGGHPLMARALINAPARARRGSVIEIKTLISHVMETGFRFTQTGEAVSRDIITGFTAVYNGEEVFRAKLYPAIAANPFLSFHVVATESGIIELKWTGDNGFSTTEQTRIIVE